ncbi:hypothetical protein R83H12_01647 [Fibrobacteria bacterium R8-3-H12]
MTCNTISPDSLCTIKQVCTDTIHNISYDSLTVAMLEKSQAFYSNSFNWLLGTIAALIPILVIIISFAQYFISKTNIKNTKEEIEKMEKQMKEELEKTKKEFNKETEEKIREIESKFELLKNEFEKHENKIGMLYRLVSIRHYNLAMESLKRNDYFEYFSNMYIYYNCITGINLNRFDSSHTYTAYKELSDKYEKNKNGIRAKIKETGSYFFMLIEYLLDFIKYCEENQKEYFDNAKLIYNGFCNMYSDNGDIVDGLKENLELNRYESEAINKLLNLAERYKDKNPPPQNEYSLNI